MVSLRIHLDGDNCWSDLADRELIQTTNMEVAMLVGGMQSGKISVAFRLDLSDGKTVIVETSLQLLESAVLAMKARESVIQPKGSA